VKLSRAGPGDVLDSQREQVSESTTRLQILAEGLRWKWQDGRSGRIYRTLLAVGRLVLQGRLTQRSLDTNTALSTDLLPLADAHLTGAWKGMES
jgi:hypothetical protein